MLLWWVMLALLGGTVTAEASCVLPTRHGKAEVLVTCSAQSYKGTFSCSWETRCLATFRLHLRHRGQGSVACSSRKVRARPGSVHVQLQNCTFCAYAEEQEMQLELEVQDKHGHNETLVTELFLHDVVRPASPECLVARSGENPWMVTLSWAPPTSWNLSTTYFPLQYHLQLQLFRTKGSRGEEDIFSERLEETREYKQMALEARIRCRDALSKSRWSSWSDWVNVQPQPSGRAL